MILFHGSPNIIPKPIFGFGNPKNDYGLGFYCSETLELAKEWACTTEEGGYANQYAFDMSGLNVINLSDGDYHILNWLAILLENRTFKLGGDLSSDARDYILRTFKPVLFQLCVFKCDEHDAFEVYYRSAHGRCL